MTIYDDSLFMPASSAASTQRISFDDDISKHCQWAYEHIYQKSYRYGKARHCHGILHVSRAAMFGVMWANIRRRQGDPEAIGLTERDLKLIQIAILFHDSARENDGVDHWDNESAINLYKYLTITLGVSHEEAAKIAEATANKDHAPGKEYYELATEGGLVTFREARDIPRERNIFQKIIHDSDCLDIMRCNPLFDARYLDFYKDYCQSDSSADTAMILIEIITEAQALMTLQGDYWKFLHEDKKARCHEDKKASYQDGEAYPRIIADTKRREIGVSLLQALVRCNQVIAPETLQAMPEFQVPQREAIGGVLTLENVVSLIRRVRQGPPYLFYRGIGSPSAKPKKSTKDLTLVELEIRKLLRDSGNPARSVSMLPSEMYTRAGFLVLLDEGGFSDVHQINAHDFGSECGKKTKDAVNNLDAQETIRQCEILARQITLEPPKDSYAHRRAREEWSIAHNEVLLTIRKGMIKGIAYSRDASMYSSDVCNADAMPIHPDVGLLEAYFIQQTYQKQTGIILPIFEVSYYSHLIRKEEMNLQRLINAWRNVCKAYISDQLKKGHYQAVMNRDIETLKVMMIYGNTLNRRAIGNQSVDMYYHPTLKKLIGQIIIEIREEEIQSYEERFIAFIQGVEPAHDPVAYLDDFCAQMSSGRNEILKRLLMLKIEDETLRQKRTALLSNYVPHEFDSVISNIKDLFAADSFHTENPNQNSKLAQLEIQYRFIRQNFPEMSNQIREAIKHKIAQWILSKDIDAKNMKFACRYYNFSGVYDKIQSIISIFKFIDEDAELDEIESKKQLKNSFLGMLDSLARNATDLRLISIFHVGVSPELINIIKIMKVLEIDATELPKSFIEKQIPANQSERKAMGSAVLLRAKRFPEVIQAYLQNDQHDERFNKFVEALFYDQERNSYDIRPIKHIYQALLVLQDAMPNKSFSEEQLKRINDRLFTYVSKMDFCISSSLYSNLYSNQVANMFLSLSSLIRAFVEFRSPVMPDILCRHFFVFTMAHLRINLWDERNFITKKYIKLFKEIGFDIDGLKRRVVRSLLNFPSLLNDQTFMKDFLLISDDSERVRYNLMTMKKIMEEIEKSALIMVLTSSEEPTDEIVLAIREQYRPLFGFLESISQCILIDNEFKANLIYQSFEVNQSIETGSDKIWWFVRIFADLINQRRHHDIEKLWNSDLMPKSISFQWNELSAEDTEFFCFYSMIPKRLRIKFLNRYGACIANIDDLKMMLDALPEEQRFNCAIHYTQLITDLYRFDCVLNTLPDTCKLDYAKRFYRLYEKSSADVLEELINKLPESDQQAFRDWLSFSYVSAPGTMWPTPARDREASTTAATNAPQVTL